jgi:hypothetical protein
LILALLVARVDSCKVEFSSCTLIFFSSEIKENYKSLNISHTSFLFLCVWLGGGGVMQWNVVDYQWKDIQCDVKQKHGKHVPCK